MLTWTPQRNIHCGGTRHAAWTTKNCWVTREEHAMLVDPKIWAAAEPADAPYESLREPDTRHLLVGRRYRRDVDTTKPDTPDSSVNNGGTWLAVHRLKRRGCAPACASACEMMVCVCVCACVFLHLCVWLVVYCQRAGWGRQADRQTHRHTDTQTHTHKHRHTDTQTHRHTDTQTHRHTDTQTHRQTDKQTDRQIDRLPTQPGCWKPDSCCALFVRLPLQTHSLGSADGRVRRTHHCRCGLRPRSRGVRHGLRHCVCPGDVCEMWGLCDGWTGGRCVYVWPCSHGMRGALCLILLQWQNVDSGQEGSRVAASFDFLMTYEVWIRLRYKCVWGQCVLLACEGLSVRCVRCVCVVSVRCVLCARICWVCGACGLRGVRVCSVRGVCEVCVC